MKWNIIKSTWEYREPTFKCWFFHWLFGGFAQWQNGLYPPDEKNELCRACHVWWVLDIKREERYYPAQFVLDPYDAMHTILNEPFWLMNTADGFNYKNPLYTDEYGWLNGRGIALVREQRYDREIINENL
jgi:hypothetical protein